MKILNLKVENFRGLTFDHDFTDDQFIVLTGINGSGKSTIIEAVDILLSKHHDQIQQQFAEQVTSTSAVFEISIGISDAEIIYLASRILASQPNLATEGEILEALKVELFVNNKYRRKLVVQRPQPIVEWSVSNNVIEYINDTEVIRNHEAEAARRISPNIFNILSQEMIIRFDQLDSINLSYSPRASKAFSLSSIFQAQNINEPMRMSRTNLTASSFLDSLIEYDNSDDTDIIELLTELNSVIEPLQLEIGTGANGLRDVVLRRNISDVTYGIGSASSGQKKAIALTILRHVWARSTFKPIVLLDEPENSMHPGLITRVFSIMNELTHAALQPSFIVATHSPEVVAASPKNTYRIIASPKIAHLEKIVGLEDRAKALNELGVHFHLDYVAQKLVFVESVREKLGGELSDEEVYQRLIDPLKEEVLFISVGNNIQTEEKYKFQKELFDTLKASSTNLIYRLKDRDDHDVDDSHTPFRHIEYIFLCSPDALSSALSKATAKEIAKKEIESLLKSPHIETLLKIEDYKGTWKKVLSHYGIRNKVRGFIQGDIADMLNKTPKLRTKSIQSLVNRYRSGE